MNHRLVIWISCLLATSFLIQYAKPLMSCSSQNRQNTSKPTHYSIASWAAVPKPCETAAMCRFWCLLSASTSSCDEDLKGFSEETVDVRDIDVTNKRNWQKRNQHPNWIIMREGITSRTHKICLVVIFYNRK